MSMLKKLASVTCASLMVLHMGCSGSYGPNSSTATQGNIKISVRSIMPRPSNSLGKAVTSVTITRAQVVIDQVEFESSLGDTLDFKLRDPFVQDLALDTNLQVLANVQVPFGTYKEMEIEIDDLNDPNSPAFAQNPDLQNLSIRVEGVVDDTVSFVFTSDLSEEQEREFDPPLVLDETSPNTNVVLIIDTGVWFVDRNGNPIDPTLGGNRKTIERNIKNSIDVFEDDDDDGVDDDDTEEDDDDRENDDDGGDDDDDGSDDSDD